ncbi:MAG: hypothetical protein H7A41_07260 [Chlamydiales bacterium]|nr:hypothetical protein [Chlamydiales bacterium]
MATISTSIDLSATFAHDPMEDLGDPMGDLDEVQIDEQQGEFSEHAHLLAEGIHAQASAPAPTSKKRAYFWVKAKEGDKAFRTEKMDSDRSRNMEILRKQGYEVVIFKTNREFFDHIAVDREPVDLLVISDHGTPHSVGDLRIQGDRIVSKDSTLTRKERQEGFESLRPLLKEGSILLFDACLAGNKTFENNIASVASRIIPQAKVFAAQHSTTYEPGFMYAEDAEKGVVIDSIYYGHKQGRKPVEIVHATVYQNGVELTGQEAVPCSFIYRIRKAHVIGALAIGAVATAIGVGAWWYSQAS